MKINSFGASDVGLVRLNNEDVWARMPNEQFFILADGMGGHQAGEIAASETVIYLCKLIKDQSTKKHSVSGWIKLIDQGIRQANTQVYTLASNNPEMEGMGTTLCLALITDSTLIAAHVGDSRLYRLRKGRLLQLTRDHSLRDELIEKGELDESLAPTFPYKNVITRAIGTQTQVTPEIHTFEIEGGDLYFLCSDGLTDALLDPQIAHIIQEEKTLEAATEALILAAKNKGGNDNITIVMLKVSK